MTAKKKKLYNLTLHKQRNLGMIFNDNPRFDGICVWEIEEAPRLVPVKNPQNWTELKMMVRKAVKGIPKGSSVLIGGMTQIAVLIAELDLFQLYYVVLDDDNGRKPRAVPIDFDSHRGWTRQQKFKIEEGS